MRADISGLTSVRSELNQGLDRVRQALETYIEEEADRVALETCLDELHQVCGSLKVLRLHAAALLVGDMQQAVRAVLDEQVLPDEALFEVLFGAGLQLVDYLDYIPHAKIETDLLLLPVINELRVALQQPVLGEDDLFVHVLNEDPVMPAGLVPDSSGADLSKLAKRSLPRFQAALLGVLRQGDGPHLTQMKELAGELEQAGSNAEIQRLWLLTSAVFEAMGDGLVAGIELKRLLGRLSVFLRNQAERGEAAMGNAERSLMHGLLYQLGRSKAGGEKCNAVRQAYGLNELLPDSDQLASIRTQMRGPNTSLLNTVTREIRADLHEVRDNIDLLMRSGELSEAHTQETGAALRRVGATLGMLGLEDLQRVVQRQAGVIEAAQDKPDPRSPQWQEVATTLLWIDHSLEQILLQRESDTDEPAVEIEPAEGSISPQELKAGSEAIFREAQSNMARIKELLENFAKSGEPGQLADVSGLLHEISAALSMLGYREVSELMVRLRDVLGKDPQASLADNPETQERIADAIADAERLIASLQNEHIDQSAMLAELRNYVDALDGAGKASTEDAIEFDQEAFFDLPPLNEEEELSAPDDLGEVEIEEQEVLSPEAASPQDQIREIFMEELEEIQTTLAQSLPRWLEDQADLAALGDVRRSFHTLKGSGRMAEANDIGEFGWAVENLLNRCLEADLTVTKEIQELVESAVAQLPALAQGLSDETALSEEARSLIIEAHKLAGTEPPASIMAAATTPETPEPEVGQPEETEEAPAAAATQGEEGEDEDDLEHIFLRDALGQMEKLADFFTESGPELDPLPVPHDVVRAFHTLKSGAALAGLPAMSALSAELEQLCDHCQQQGEPMSTEAMQIVKQAGEGLLQTLEAFQAGEELPDLEGLRHDVSDLRDMLAMQEAEAEGAEEDQVDLISFTDEAYALIEQVESRLAALELEAGDPDERDRLLAGLEALGALSQGASIEILATLADRMRSQIQATDELTTRQRGLYADLALGMYGLLDELRQGRRNLEAEDLLAMLEQAAEPDELVEPAMTEQPEVEVLESEVPEAADTETLVTAEPELPQDEPTAEQEAAAETGSPDTGAADLVAEEEAAPIIAIPQDEAAGMPESVMPAVAENDEMLELFLGEGEELLEEIDKALDAWEHDPSDKAPAGELLRLLHTIKGGARMAGAETVGDISHDLESQIEVLQRAGESPDKAFLGALRNGSDAMHAQLERFRAPTPVEPPTTERPVAEQASGATPATWAESLYWEPEVSQKAAAAGGQSETARVPVGLLDKMLNEAGEINIYRGRLEQQHADLASQLVEFEQAVERLRGLIRELDKQSDAQVHAGRSSASGAEGGTDRYGSQFDPLEMDRYTRLNELSRSLNEGAADLSSLHGLMEETSRDAETLLLQQGRVATSLQHGLMDTLLVPFTRQVQRLQRLVRQASQTHERNARIEFEGVENELDRNVLERMTGPLEHLLRNAIVHGIETPEERKKAGKDEEGVLRIAIRRDGTQSIIEVSDDGRGLDMKAIRKKAEERGLVPKKAKVDDDVLWQFIFEPGFSTADALTQEAGRGVGMDVVNAEIKQLGGTISVSSKPKQGARFLIRIPSSLAISNSLLIRVAGEQYAIPMASIEGVERISAKQLATELADKDNAKGIHYGGQHYQLIRLEDYLGGDNHEEEEDEVDTTSHPMLLMQVGENRLALVVDRVVGGQELVVKSLGPQVSAIAGVKGGAILADGSVVLILDIQALYQAQRRRGLAVEPIAAATVERVKDQRPMVMVVDDSITIRRVTEKFLLRNGFRVCTAKDGMDALPKLQTEAPELVLLDIEMPRIDGFEFATYMRNSEQFARIPIIMITSRSGEKHQRRAKQIGVQGYMIKPYQEEALLSSIRDVMKASKEEAVSATTEDEDGDKQ